LLFLFVPNYISGFYSKNVNELFQWDLYNIIHEYFMIKAGHIYKLAYHVGISTKNECEWGERQMKAHYQWGKCLTCLLKVKDNREEK